MREREKREETTSTTEREREREKERKREGMHLKPYRSRKGERITDGKESERKERSHFCVSALEFASQEERKREDPSLTGSEESSEL